MSTTSSASSADHGDCPSETSSRSLTKTVTVTHNFEITSYSMLDGYGPGKYISSKKFTAGGYDWDIMFYPNGEEEEDSLYSSVFLCLRGGQPGSPGVRTNYTLSLLDKHGNATILRSAMRHTFKCLGSYYGYPRFFAKTHTDDDCFTIRCLLTVMTHRTEDVSAVVVPRSNLHDHLLDMLNGGEGTDVTFNVGGQLFDAHRCILAARSPVFKAELFGEIEENATRQIKVNDMKPVIFHALLQFIYTDAFPDKNCGANKNVALQQLFVAADRYGLERLRAMCEHKLCQSINVHTVSTTLALAEQHQCEQLKHACLGYMSSHGVLNAIRETDGFKKLMSSFPSLIGDIINKVVGASGRAAKKARVQASQIESSFSSSGDY